MPPNENNRRMTRSQGKAKSSTSSAATKKPLSTSSAAKSSVAKSSVAKSSVAATNASSSGTTKGRGGGRKPSTANSTAVVEDINEIVTRVDLGLDLPEEEQKRNLEQTKSKLEQTFRRLGVSNIRTDLTPTDVEELEACIQLENEDIEKLIKEWAPGYQKGRVTKPSTLFDHLRKAVLPAPSVALIPYSKNDAKKRDVVSLRATFFSICGVQPQFSNGWTQKMMIDGIERQKDSESKGGDYHYTRLTDEDLSRKVRKRCVKRLAMVRKAWQHDNRHDYTKPSQVRNVTAIEPDIAPALAAPAAEGGPDPEEEEEEEEVVGDAASGGGAHSDEVDEENVQATGAAIARNEYNELKAANTKLKVELNEEKQKYNELQGNYVVVLEKYNELLGELKNRNDFKRNDG